MSKEIKTKQEVWKCSNCRRCFFDVGDDHWVECPYCQCQTGHQLAIENKDFKYDRR